MRDWRNWVMIGMIAVGGVTVVWWKAVELKEQRGVVVSRPPAPTEEIKGITVWDGTPEDKKKVGVVDTKTFRIYPEKNYKEEDVMRTLIESFRKREQAWRTRYGELADLCIERGKTTKEKIQKALK